MSKLGFRALGGRVLVLAAAAALLLSVGCMARMMTGGYGGVDGVMMPGMMAGGKDGGGMRGMMSGGWASYEKVGGWEWVGPYEGPQGMYVSGYGTVSGSPDIAVISMGVESVEDTAAAARAKAAAAMAGVMAALAEANVAEEDIQTRYFSISPRYRNVQQAGGDWEYVLTGYAVSNQATVKIRDLDSAGAVIDAVTAAAGDLIRVNGIDFGIEDAGELEDAARAAAIADMARKAEMMADASGVELGRLVYLSEIDYPQAQLVSIERSVALDEGGGFPLTGISAGELDVTARVQGVYLIWEAWDTEE